jgi:hypothetical protein
MPLVLFVLKQRVRGCVSGLEMKLTLVQITDSLCNICIVGNVDILYGKCTDY